MQVDQLDQLLRNTYYNVDVVVDMLAFSDPIAGPLKAHIGEHPEILWRMLQHPHFPTWLRNVVYEVRQLLHSRGHARVAFFCRAGRHRSIAGAWFLHHVSETMGWQCMVSHLSKQDWKGTCPEQCSACRPGPSDLRDQALRRALSILEFD